MRLINEETVQMYLWISQPRFDISKKMNPLGGAAFDADCLTPVRILKIITAGLKNGFW